MPKISDPIWYIFKNKKKSGPFTIQQVQDFHRLGSIDNLTLLWRVGAKKWLPYRQMKKHFYDVSDDVDKSDSRPEPLYLKNNLKSSPGSLPSLPELPPLSGASQDTKAFEPPRVPKNKVDDQKAELPPVPKTQGPLKVSLPKIPLEALSEIKESDLIDIDIDIDIDINEQSHPPQFDQPEISNDQRESQVLESEKEVSPPPFKDFIEQENELLEQTAKIEFPKEIEVDLSEDKNSEIRYEPLPGIEESTSQNDKVLNLDDETREDHDSEHLASHSHSGLENERPYPVISTIAGGALLMLTTVILIVTLVYYTGVEKDITFRNISIDVMNKLTAKKDSTKFYVNLGASKDLNYIFGRSNLVKDAEYEAIFKKLSNNSDELVFTSSAIANKGHIKFDKFDFREGEGVREGEYEIKVSARLTNIFDLLLNYIQSKPIYFESSTKTFLVKKSIDDFEQSLKKIKLNKKLKKLDQFKVLSEKTQTLSTIVTSMGLSFNIALDKGRGVQASKDFEARYASSAGAILQSLIVDDYMGELKSSKNALAAQNIQAQILTLSKQIAAWSVDLSSKLEKVGVIKESEKKNLKASMSKERDAFKARIDDLNVVIKQEEERI